MRNVFFLLTLAPSLLFSQLYTGEMKRDECTSYRYCIRLHPDSSVFFTEEIVQQKVSRKCPLESQRLVYYYGKMRHVKDSVYAFDISGNDVFNFELHKSGFGLHDLRTFGTDTTFIAFDSIKPNRIGMRWHYSFRLRYENKSDTIYFYKDLVTYRNPNYSDTSMYARFCRSYAYRYNPKWFKPGKHVYINIGLLEPLTGKDYEFEIPYGFYPYFSWHTRVYCASFDNIYFKNDVFTICDLVNLRRRNKY
jgi:hypothetical protein